MASIELKDLSKAWNQVVAVDAIDLAITDGEFLAILGPSGCGKSTTLFMLAGIYVPTGGEIRFDGARVNEVEARDRNVGIVFQSYALYPNMTVMQNIMFPLRFKTIAKAEAESKAQAVAELVQVGELLARRPGQLSGGQQQRVALARAIIKEPNLLLLDEPLSNLDATLRLTMRTELRRIQRELGVTTILVTHDQIEATTMADRIVCMNKGRIEQVGSADDLYARPRSTFVASFIGSPPINFVDMTRDGDSLRSGEESLELVSANGADSRASVRLGVRPENLRAAASGIPAIVHSVEPMGREVLYVCDTPLGPLRFLEPFADAAHGVGDSLRLTFDSRQSIIFDAESGNRIDGLTARAPTTTTA
ncbi:ABC transporter ATP-binding protein [Bauldia sp.]|uniref:ABC transporter ATP-binding protein n=1 Tax=Bauldia sp. TaxID=2575872 RepID=UPI003BA8E127